MSQHANEGAHADADHEVLSSSTSEPSDSPVPAFNIIPQFALHAIVGYLTFPEVYQLCLLSSDWRQRMLDDDLLWKFHLRLQRPELVIDGGPPPPPPPRYFCVPKSDLCLQNVAHAFGVETSRLSVQRDIAAAAENHNDGSSASSSSSSLKVGSVVRVDFLPSFEPDIELLDQSCLTSWRRRHQDSYLTDLFLRFLCKARVETVFTPHEFGYRRVLDLPPLPAVVTNGVYHYNNVRSRLKAAWIADRYLHGVQINLGYFGPVTGRCMGSTRTSGWIVLGDRERARRVVTVRLFCSKYDLGCVNNWDGKYPFERYESSMRFLLDLFFEAAEPGAVFLSAAHVMRLGDEEEHEEEQEEEQEEKEEVVAADGEDGNVGDHYRDFISGYDLDKDNMVVAVGRTRVVSFYWFLNRHYG